MATNKDQSALDHRWDLHTERQIATAKAGITAVTVLNTGSWLAILTQADKLAALGAVDVVSNIFLAWGMGALTGTATWIFIYWNTLFLASHDFDRDSKRQMFGLNLTRWLGIALALLSLACFAFGVWSLSQLPLVAKIAT